MSWIRLVGSAVLAAWLALLVAQTRDKPLWMDEHFSIFEAVGQVPMLIADDSSETFDSRQFWADSNPRGVLRATLAGDNGNMSLFGFVLHFVLKFADPSRIDRLTIVTILSYGLAVIGTYRLGRYLFTEKIGLLAAFLCACNAWMLLFALEIRSYAPAVALSLISTECFARIVGLGAAEEVERDRRRMTLLTGAYATISLLALLTHFLTGLILMGQVIYAVLAVRDKAAWRRLIIAGAGVSFTFVLIHRTFLVSDGYLVVDRYVAYLQKDGRHKNVSSNLKSYLDRIAAAVFVLSGFTALPSLGPIPAKFYAPLLPIVMLGSALVPGISRSLLAKNFRPVMFLNILAWICLGFVLFGLASGRALIPTNMRYIVFSVPYFMILIAVAADNLLSGQLASKAFRAIAAGFVVVYLGCSLVAPAKTAIFAASKKNTHALAARKIGAMVDSGQSVKVIVPGVLDLQLLSFYLGPNRSVPIEISDRKRYSEIREFADRSGFRHPIAYHTETRDAYAGEGLDISRLVLVSEGNAEMRFGYEPKEKSSGPSSP